MDNQNPNQQNGGSQNGQDYSQNNNYGSQQNQYGQPGNQGYGQNQGTYGNQAYGQGNQQYNQNGQGYNQNYSQNGQNYNQQYNQNGQGYNQNYSQNGQNYNQNYNQGGQGYNQNYNPGFNGNQENSYTGPVPAEFRVEKSVAACVVLSIVTCGIYAWFWMWGMVKKIRMVTGQTDDCVGEYLLLMLVPYYNVYWVYTRAKKLYENAGFRGIQISDNSVLFLILNIFGLSIVSFAMMQDQLNSLARRV